MAEFKISYSKTKIHEGGYVNHSSDRGQETFRGISRKFHPLWSGWTIVNEAVSKVPVYPNNTLKWKTINAMLKDNTQLNQLVEDFYRNEFWNRIRGEAIVSQQLADVVFDTAVWSGVKVSSKHLQRALNMLNSKQLLWGDVTVDGVIGQKTLYTVLECSRKGFMPILIKVIYVIQGALIVDILENDKSQEDFAIGWFDRV